MENKSTYQHKGDCEIGCDEYIDTQCVVYLQSLPYLGLEEGASLTEIIQKLVNTIQHLQSQINEG